MRIDSTDLQMIVALAETGSVSSAARRINLSVAATSERLMTLERRVEQVLFVRKRSGLQTTPAGDTLLRHSRSMLRLLEQAEIEFQGLDSDHQGHLRLLANTSAVTEFMPQILSRFMVDRPQVRVELFECNYRETIQGVLKGEADLGIVAASEAPRLLESALFASDRMVVVASDSHALGRRRSLRYEDTLDFPQVSLELGTSYGDFMRDIRNRLGWQPKTRIELKSFEAMCIMISAGVGVGVVPESVARRHARSMRLAIYSLKDSWARRDRYLVARSFQGLPGAAKVLVQAVHNHFGGQAGVA
jgi:DNA-binding transcriptional LysR family regulator